MPDRLTRLKSLAVTRVAFVGAGDNPDAHVLLWKADPERAWTDAVHKRAFSRAKRVELAKSGAAIPVKGDDGEIVDGRYPIETVADLKNAMRAIGRVAEGDRAEVIRHVRKRAKALGATDELSETFKGEDVSEVKKGPKQMTRGRLQRLFGVRDEIDSLLSEVDADREEVAVSEEHKELIDALPEEKRADVEKAIADAAARGKAEAEAAAEKAREDAEPEPEPDEALDKALAEMPAPVAKAIEDLRKRADDAEAESKSLRETVDAAEEDRKVREATEAAKALKALTVNPDEFGKVLAKLREDSPESAAEVERVLAAANNSVGEFLTEIGKGGDAESEAEAELEKMAKSYKADHPDVTDEKAMAEVASTPEGRALRAEIKRGV